MTAMKTIAAVLLLAACGSSAPTNPTPLAPSPAAEFVLREMWATLDADTREAVCVIVNRDGADATADRIIEPLVDSEITDADMEAFLTINC